MHKVGAVRPDPSADGDIPALPDRSAVRDWVAHWVIAHEGMIRRIARDRLTTSARAVYDSEDVFATVLKRMDDLASRGALRLDSSHELTALLATIVRRSAANKSRLIERSRRLAREDGEYATLLLARLENCEDDDEATLVVCRMMSWLDGAENRQILGLRLRGLTHSAVAQALGMNATAVRQRWVTIKRTLMERMERGEL